MHPHELSDLLENEAGIDSNYTYNELPQKQPDERINITELWGNLAELEGEMDFPMYQIRVRAPRDDPQRAQTLAFQVDRWIKDRTSFPRQVGDWWVYSMGRLGGRPGFLMRDDQHRAIYACNYYAQVIENPAP